jgi:hypothetical protein
MIHKGRLVAASVGVQLDLSRVSARLGFAMTEDEIREIVLGALAQERAEEAGQGAGCFPGGGVAVR